MSCSVLAAFYAVLSASLLMSGSVDAIATGVIAMSGGNYHCSYNIIIIMILFLSYTCIAIICKCGIYSVSLCVHYTIMLIFKASPTEVERQFKPFNTYNAFVHS